MIVAAAVKLNDGRVFVGKRHNDCFAIIIELYKQMGIDYEESQKLHFNCVQGFITDTLVFLNRTDAYYEAFKCKQCEEQKYRLFPIKGFTITEEEWKPMLASEDLY